MAKGASIKFKSYQETIPKLLGLLNMQKELRKYDSIVLKVSLTGEEESSTSLDFVESVLDFVMKTKNPVASVVIAEGADGHDTGELFESMGYQKLAEKHSIGLIDLNNTEINEVHNSEFLRFEKIQFPRILANSFIISLSKLSDNDEFVFNGTLSNMLGAYPSKYYKGFFSSTKNKIRKGPIKYALHDILKCRMPNFAIMDASENGVILAGLPLEIDKQTAKFFQTDWTELQHLRLIEDSFSPIQ